ncbi:MAG: DMT family transporter [Clostridia bacterium]|nr:DMT family transporter [Clostridia bacterium]MBQ4084980.1 DMT family transporter [Clostridia bacterium]
MDANQKKGVLFAVLAAVFYALNAPFSKLLLGSVPPTMMAAFLYLGAGIGMAAMQQARKNTSANAESRFTRKELPYTIGMVVLDIAAPIFLMIGIAKTSAANASLLNNFEIVATSMIALLVFRERISRKLWLGIGLVTLSSLILTAGDIGSLSVSVGSLYVLAACVCWGLENNCTRALSSKDPVQIVVIKGLFSGAGALVVGETLPAWTDILFALVLGFVAYGLSIMFYIYAQRWLGAAKTSAYYAIAPFVGVALSLLIFREVPSASFLIALVVMVAGTYVVTFAEN